MEEFARAQPYTPARREQEQPPLRTWEVRAPSMWAAEERMAKPLEVDFGALSARCAALLRDNRVVARGKNGATHRYTRPAPSTYEQQWLLDSCFHAIALRWIDPSMAWDELHSVVANQVENGSDAGMVAHMTYWDGVREQGPHEPAEALWGRSDRSIITQPSLMAVATEMTHNVAPNMDALRALYPKLRAHHRWLERRRDPDADGLVACIHPWETGWDAQPRWDPLMRARDTSHDGLRDARIALAKTCREHDCDPRMLMRHGYFHVETCDFNAVRVADLEALTRIAELCGDKGEAVRLREIAARARAAIQAKLWRADEVVDLSGPDEAPITDGGAAQYILLFGGCATDAQAEVLARRLKQAMRDTKYALSTVLPSHPDFDPTRYWRGNVWLQVNWLIWMGLRRYGFGELAGELAEHTIGLATQRGFHEYFDPLSGDGRGSHPHSWDAIVLDMVCQGRTVK